MRVVLGVFVLATLAIAASGAGVDVGLSTTMWAQGTMERPTVDPATTNTAAWATMLWLGVGLVFLVLLVGGAMLGMRSRRDRSPGPWRRGTPE